MSKTLLVQTMSLNALIDEDAWTYVDVGGGQYVRKKARDLAHGDAVVVMNEHISKTLPEVEEELRTSLRYSLAEDRLKPLNKEGRRIATFRTLLLRGLTGESASGESLEERIMLENRQDFSDEDYADYSRRILSVTQGVGGAAVSQWLKPDAQGTFTLAPRDWENFLRLSSINGEFLQIYESQGKETGYRADYDLYVGVRRTVMRHLAQRGRPLGAQEETYPEIDAEPRIRGKYAQEIGLVVRRFMSEITANHSTSMVVKVKEIKGGEKRKLGSQRDTHLSTGIATSFNGKTVDMELVRERQYIANYALTTALVRYFSSKLPTNADERVRELLQYVAPDYAKNVLTSRLHIEKAYEEGLFLKACQRIGIAPEDARPILQGAYDQFIFDMRDGAVDAAAGLPAHTVVGLVDVANTLKRTLPREYHEMVLRSSLRHDIRVEAGRQGGYTKKRDDDASLEADILRANRYLMQTYGMRSNEDVKWLLLQCHDNHMQQGRAPANGYDYAAVARSRQAYEQKGFKFYSLQEVRSHMEAMGLPSAMALIDNKNFINAQFLK